VEPIKGSEVKPQWDPGTKLLVGVQGLFGGKVPKAESLLSIFIPKRDQKLRLK